jgi:glyoxylase-like metal-dependent hydrolase (beta-lactamase superfamily II)
MFRRLSIPTPFQVGAVNAYLAGRTVVDPGPESERAWETLLEELEARNLAPDDVEQVVITHPHPDHFGLANRLRNLGATVFASGPAAGIIEDFEGRLKYEQSFFVPFLERHGVPTETAGTVVELPRAFLEYAPDVETDEVLVPGETIRVDGKRLEVVEAQGHATGEVVLAFDEDGGRSAVVGDQVLGDITPNPLLQPPATEGGDRPRVLPAFNRSLERLRDREFQRILPGHREVIAAPSERIDEILEAHERRTGNVYELVEGETTAVEVMEGLFEDLPATEVFSGMSEAIGHLDVLEERGRVEATRTEEAIAYERV